MPKTRRVSVYAEREFGNLGVHFGGLWAGEPLNGRKFQLAREENGVTEVFVDEIDAMDNFGGKLKLTYQEGKFNWYGQAALMGLVANGGYDQTITFTGWRLKDSGSGNQYNVLTGFAYTIGNIQIAPNFLWQKPIEGPIPTDTGIPGARPRNIIDDPFAVRSNREQTAYELVLTWDPTPGTWMYNWDSDRSEDAGLAVSLGVVYRQLPTVMDAAIGIFPDGRTTFPFDGSVPAEDLLEVNARVVSKMNRNFGFIANIYGGEGQANGSDDRKITRFGTDLRMIYKNVKLNSFVRFNDWGPFDYHRDFNQTYPLQVMADFSTTLGKPDWFDLPTTRLGVRGTYRTLDKYSPRYSQVEIDPATGVITPIDGVNKLVDGTEWEIRTYIQIDIRN
jgi:hypothetical protein